MSDHARLSPSGSGRWIGCPASVSFIDRLRAAGEIPEDSPLDSPAAAEGTHAHVALEYALTEGRDPLELVEGWFHDRYLEEETARAIKVAYDYVMGFVNKGAKIHIERKLRPDPDIGEDVYGTADVIIMHPRGTVEVVDYKHGKGVAVPVKDNTQCQIYLLLSLYNLSDADPEMGGFTTIIQPRHAGVPDIQTLGYTSEQLVEIQERIRAAVLEVDSADPSFGPSDKACKFCPALARCAAATETSVKALTSAAEAPGLGKLPALIAAGPEALTTDQLAVVLENESLIRDWISAVHKHAHELLMQGKDIPGFGLKQGRQSRGWDLDEEDMIEYLRTKRTMRKRITLDMITDSKLISPAKAEKVLKPKVTDKVWEEIAGHITVVRGKPSITAVKPDEMDQLNQDIRPKAEDYFTPVNPLAFLG